MYKTVTQFTVVGLVLFTLVCMTKVVAAQTKPTEFESRADDKALCSGNGSLRPTEYCDFWLAYNSNRTSNIEQQLIEGNILPRFTITVESRITNWTCLTVRRVEDCPKEIAMKTKDHYQAVIQLTMAGFVLLVLLCATPVVSAQSKPTEFDSRLDDKALCASKGSLRNTEYCDFWSTYNTNRRGSADQQRVAADARNELIKYVRGRVDRFYEEYTNRKKFNRSLLQTIFDMLEIGAAAAIGITNGERAKEVIGIALGAVQATRTSLNKQFDLLQTRIIINKMRENRAQVLARIVSNMRKPVSDYSWLDAKNDLREYLYVGTFSNAMDSLAAETGDAAQEAEKVLRTVSGDLLIVPEATQEEALIASTAQRNLEQLSRDLLNDQTRPAATTSLRNILTELNKEPLLRQRTEAKGLSATSEGAAILAGIIEVRREAVLGGRSDLASQINKAIVAVMNVR